MNFRKLLTYLTVSTAAVIPFAGAQNPTILQGSYISNVFGNSNFVKNPNAQTNVANVTNATRSITTPLVATSEFNLNLTSGSFATWTLRAFDAGMKGQNCEARFSYRGFATATTTAEIVQNSLVVAQLVLTPSTDPRIASINFPCGDLVNATTFRIAQTTANMTIVTPNEIGGIYVGLATNMANVAQAEFVGSLNWPVQSATTATTSATYVALGNIGTTNPTPIGDVTFSAQAPKITINSLKPGNYTISFNGTFGCYNSTQDAICNYRLTDGSTEFGASVAVRSFGATSSSVNGTWVPVLTYNFQYTGAVTSKTFQLEARAALAGGSVEIGQTLTQGFQISVYRFPSASELVVTPERQNTFAAARFHTSINTTVHSGGTAPTGYSILADASFASNVTRFGKAAAPLASGCAGGVSCSVNDFGFSVPNMPIGSYSVRVNGLLNATAGSNTTECSFQILEAVSGTSVGKQSHVDPLLSAVSSREFNASYAGVFNNTSVATRNFIMRAEKVAGSTTGNCQVNASTTRDLYMELIPLDQPSNSALYVQGPVLGSATGAAIPEGYVNEFATRSITDTSLRSQLSPVQNTVYFPWTGELTLPAGNWMLCYKVAANLSQSGTTSSADIRSILQNKTDGTTVTELVTWPTLGAAITNVLNTHSACKPIAITASKTFRVGVKYIYISGTPTVTEVYLRGDQTPSELYAIRLN